MIGAVLLGFATAIVVLGWRASRVRADSVSRATAEREQGGGTRRVA